jgi:hypothetical protein
MMKHLNLLNGPLKLFCQFIIRGPPRTISTDPDVAMESGKAVEHVFSAAHMGYALLKKQENFPARGKQKGDITKSINSTEGLWEHLK